MFVSVPIITQGKLNKINKKQHFSVLKLGKKNKRTCNTNIMSIFRWIPKMSIIHIPEKALHASNSYISLCVFIGKILSVLKTALFRQLLYTAVTSERTPSSVASLTCKSFFLTLWTKPHTLWHSWIFLTHITGEQFLMEPLAGGQ